MNWRHSLLIFLFLSLVMGISFLIYSLKVGEEVSQSGSETETGTQTTERDDTQDDLLFYFYLSLGMIVLSLILVLLLKFSSQYLDLTNSLIQMRRTVRTAHSLRGIPRSYLALMTRDFTSADYEILQQLDEGVDVYKHPKAGDHEITRLPCFKLSAKDLGCSSEENKSCAICLESFQVNDSVRMLPCLHRYHLHCIDPWLREHAICPVCKFPALDA